MEIESCPICGSDDLEEIHGETHCTSCGAIAEVYYDEDEDDEEVSPPHLG